MTAALLQDAVELAAGPPDAPAAVPDPVLGFGDLRLRPQLLRAVAELGYEEPTPVQLAAVPALLAGRDVLAQAATGTGKTAAFALPILQRLPDTDRGRLPSALVLVPTRELAMQVTEAVHRYGRPLGARALSICGGQPIGRQLRGLDRGVDVVVATPGRALDHLQRGTLDLAELACVVLDEADEMLDMGFVEDIEAILAQTPQARQTALFSATLPPRIDGLARRHLRDPVQLRLGAAATDGETSLVRQHAYLVGREHKVAALGRVLEVEVPAAAIVFCRTRQDVDELTEALAARGRRAEALHGGMDQRQRDRVMDRVRRGGADLLVATDVAARGLDIPHLTHVVNYNLPPSPEAYTHRVGRVGRAGRQGVAVTLAEPRERRMLRSIERATRQRLEPTRLPTLSDVRARRLELTRAALRAQLLAEDRGGDLDGDAGDDRRDSPAEDRTDARAGSRVGNRAADREGLRALVESLAEEFDPRDIAVAAVRLAHGGGPEAGAEEIPEPAAGPPPRRDGARAGAAGGHRAPRSPGGRGTTRLFVGAGREVGIRPRDLVGAITGESRVRGADIGAIEIADRFSLVEVPEQIADDVVTALRRTRLKGRKATVRRDRGPRPAR